MMRWGWRMLGLALVMLGAAACKNISTAESSGSAYDLFKSHYNDFIPGSRD